MHARPGQVAEGRWRLAALGVRACRHASTSMQAGWAEWFVGVNRLVGAPELGEDGEGLGGDGEAFPRGHCLTWFVKSLQEEPWLQHWELCQLNCIERCTTSVLHSSVLKVSAQNLSSCL